MGIDLFRMERYQSLYWHEVDYDLSESGVLPMSIRELFGPAADAEAFLGTTLGYPLSEGSPDTRAAIATWYPGAGVGNVTVVNGGSEANLLTLWTLLRPKGRLAFMTPNYMQGWGLGRHLGKATDSFRLKLRGDHWELDLHELDRAVTTSTKVVMVCNPNNPTGHVLTEPEMDAVVAAADRVGAWIVADEIYRGAELDTDETSPTFWGRYDKVVITSGLSKAFAMPGLRVGWIVAPDELIPEIWEHHDYTTLTPSLIGDRLAGFAMQPFVRENILARTRGILRRNYPALDTWLRSHGELFSWARPTAGAIAYAKYDLPIKSVDLVERIRLDRSVLLVPGAMFGVGKGIRFGFGYDIGHTLEGLARIDETLEELARPAEPAIAPLEAEPVVELPASADAEPATDVGEGA
jgi:aspartate/methionine/tyrosine aminotransferase